MRAEEEKESSSTLLLKLAIPCTMLVAFNVFPIVFFFILRKNKDNLDSSACRERYGQMYETISVKYFKRPPAILGAVFPTKSVPNWGTLS